MGFGFKSDNDPKSRQRGRLKDIPVDILHEKRCDACLLNKAKLDNPKLPPNGAKKEKCFVYFLGSAPSQRDDEEGAHFSGEAGIFIEDEVPVRWRKKSRWANLIRCHTPRGRAPLFQEIEACRGHQIDDIEKHKPKVIVAVGPAALVWLLPEQSRSQTVFGWRGRFVPVKVGTHVCWAYVINSPETFMYSQSNRISDNELIFRRDLELLFEKLPKLKEPSYIDGGYTDNCSFIKKGNKEGLRILERFLEKAAKARRVAVDVETTGLRPYFKGSAIAIASVAYGNRALGFALTWPGFWANRTLEKAAQKAFVTFLQNSRKKICHNTKFEQEWFGKIYGTDVLQNTQWDDTMALAYVLDSRKGMLNLDTLILLYFGFPLKNLFDINFDDIYANNVEETMLYCAADSYWTLKLYHSLRAEYVGFKRHFLKTVKRKVRVGRSLAIAQIEGVPVDLKVAEVLTRKYSRKIKRLNKQGRQFKGWKEFREKYGRDPNVDSDDMKIVLWDILKLKQCMIDDGKGGTKFSSDKSILSNISSKKYPVIPIILELRSAMTVKSSFLDSIPNHVYDDNHYHTVYNHLYTFTNRLSSEDPNLQNQPKKGKAKEVRKTITDPDPDVIILSGDYASIEARILAMASKDEALTDAFWTGYDVHGAWSDEIFEACPDVIHKHKLEDAYSDDEEQYKAFRNITKNRWVFPLFFGSSMYSVMEAMKLPEGVCSDLFTMFWNRFEGVKEWHKEQASFYKQYGYVETLTGFPRYGPLNFNKMINTPIQGTASDLLTEAGARLSEKGIQFRMNVHDDLTFFIHKKKLEKIAHEIAREMCKITYDWINVPLVVEFECGTNWYNQKTWKEYSSNKDFGHERDL